MYLARGLTHVFALSQRSPSSSHRYDDGDKKWHRLWIEDYKFIDHMKTTTAATDGDGSEDSDDDKPLSSRLPESLAEMPNRPAPDHRAASSAMTASDDFAARMDNGKGMNEPLKSLPGPVAGSKPKENAAAQKKAVVASSSEVSAAAALTSKQGGGSKQGSRME